MEIKLGLERKDEPIVMIAGNCNHYIGIDRARQIRDDLSKAIADIENGRAPLMCPECRAKTTGIILDTGTYIACTGCDWNMKVIPVLTRTISEGLPKIVRKSEHDPN